MISPDLEALRSVGDPPKDEEEETAPTSTTQTPFVLGDDGKKNVQSRGIQVMLSAAIKNSGIKPGDSNARPSELLGGQRGGIRPSVLVLISFTKAEYDVSGESGSPSSLNED
jgi:hypothetical protein